MILSDIWAECGRLLSDPNNDRWNQAALTSRINIAQIEIQGYTRAVKTNETVTVTTGTTTASVNANVMDVLFAYKVKTDLSRLPLRGISQQELDYLYPDYQQWVSGDPRFFYYDATRQQIVMAPAPDATISSVVLSESRKPADLSLSTDTPFDANNQMIPYHMAIVHWVVSHCFMDDGTAEALNKSKFHRSGSMLRPGEYEKELGRIMAEFDSPTIVPTHVLWSPQGGRIGSSMAPSKSNPLPW